MYKNNIYEQPPIIKKKTFLLIKKNIYIWQFVEIKLLAPGVT